jgi:hypothetical protein
MEASLDTYFNVHVGEKISIPGLLDAELFSVSHVPYLENYGIRFDDIFYSGDTLMLPKTDARLIFQDCQFFEGGVHISYDELRAKVPSDMRARIYLVHLGEGYEEKDPVADGFAGFVKPGDTFIVGK